MRRQVSAVVIVMLAWASIAARAADEPKLGKLPHLEFDVKHKQVRVECEMLGVSAPLEFFCCMKGTNDYEAMVRSAVKPSDLHFALLTIGLKPGSPLKFSESTQKWTPPQGPPLHISMEYQKDGKTVVDPAWRWMRDVKSKKTAPPFTWVFTGSKVMPDGKYAADVTGYLVSIVNFDLTVIDVPELASSSNDLLEWERNPDATPKAGTKVWMVIEPAGVDRGDGDAKPAPAAGQQPASVRPPATQPSTSAAATGVDADVSAAERQAQAARDEWKQRVARDGSALRQAAEAHYEIVRQLRAQQQKLIDEADRVGRVADELEKDYQDLTTPHPDMK